MVEIGIVVGHRLKRPSRPDWAGLQQFGGQAGHRASLAGCKRDVPKAALPRECMDQHGQGVVRLAHIRGIDLAGVAGEHDLGALTNAGEDRLQRGGLEVLSFVNHDKLLL